MTTKKNTLLKNIVLSGSIALMTAGMAIADQTPGDAQTQIGAQLGVTHDAITQLLSKMEQQSQTDDGMAHADYKIKAQKEHAVVQTALEKFESYLRDSLFPEIRSDLASYNSIYTSNAYSDAQKQVLLGNMQSQMKSLFANASVRYTAAVYEVMASLGPSLESMISETNQGAFNYGDALSNYYTSNGVGFYHTNIFPSLLDGCATRSCLSLSASDQIVLVTLTDQSFGSPIVFQTLDGQSFSLNAYVIASASNVVIKNEISTYVQLVGRTDIFPDFVASMPFDVSADQVQAGLAAVKATIAAEEAARQKKAFNDLLSQRTNLINNLISDIARTDECYNTTYYDGSIRNICRVGSDSPFACQQGLGCPTSSEFQTFLTTLTTNKLSKSCKRDWKGFADVISDDAKTGGIYSCSK